MTLEQGAQLGGAISSIAILVSLIFVAVQLRQSATLSAAQARHSISLFALEISKFKAEHADRLAKVYGTSELSEGDRIFRLWDHMQMLLHAETYFRHHELGLMSKTDWDGYTSWMRGYIATPGLRECWREVGHAFSQNFALWLNQQIASVDSAVARQ